jgi:hypothetical protein
MNCSLISRVMSLTIFTEQLGGCRIQSVRLEVAVSNRVSQLLSLFDSLPDDDKRSAVVEILRRSLPGEGDIPAHGLDALADELFVALDAEEDARAADR